MLARLAIVGLAVAIRVANLLSVAEHGTFARLDGHLATPVTIEVGYGKRRRVAQHDIRAGADAPEEDAIQFIGFIKYGVAHVGWRLRGRRAFIGHRAVGLAVGEQSLDNYFGLAVAVQVAYTHVVGLIPDGVQRTDILGVLQGYLNVGLTLLGLPCFHSVGADSFIAAVPGQTIGVLPCTVSFVVLKIGLSLNCCLVNQYLCAPVGLPVEVESRFCVVAGQHAPREQNGIVIVAVGFGGGIVLSVDAAPKHALVAGRHGLRLFYGHLARLYHDTLNTVRGRTVTKSEVELCTTLHDIDLLANGVALSDTCRRVTLQIDIGREKRQRACVLRARGIAEGDGIAGLQVEY